MHDQLHPDEATDHQSARDDTPAPPDPSDSSADVPAPFAPHQDDDSALGDTDQHSTA